MRVQALEKYTNDRFHEEETECRQRIDHRLEEYGNTQRGDVKDQIQTWLEQKLEGYGHCLHHHHDDSALPNENIFSDIHETANGRLFKSRSDETLSQSDNHSGKFRKREFYESRQQAMQQIRAWQVPSYSKDRNRVKIVEKQTSSQQKRSHSQHHVNNVDSEAHRQYPIEPKVEVRAYSSKPQPPPKAIGRNSARFEDNGNYMTMTGSPQPAQRPPSRPQPQVYQSTRPQNVATRGPVTHSTPKSRESSPYTTHAGIVRSQTDGFLSQGSPRQLRFADSTNSTQDSSLQSSSGQSLMTYTIVDSSSEMKTAKSELLLSKAVSASPLDTTSTVPGSITSRIRNSTSSDKVLAETPKPTFTTFGYDETLNGSVVPVNSPDSQQDMSGQTVTTPRSSSSHSSRGGDPSNRTPLPGQGVAVSRQVSNLSYGFSPSHQDDMYVEMKHLAPPQLHQRTRSSDGLLETDIDHIHSNSHPDQSLRTHDATQLSLRSLSASRPTGREFSPSPGPQQPSRSVPMSSSYSRTNTHPMYSSTPTPNGNITRTADRSAERPVPPPKPCVPKPSIPFPTGTGPERTYNGNVNFKVPEQRSSVNPYSSINETQYMRDRNQNYKVKADIHVPPAGYYPHGLPNGSPVGLPNGTGIIPHSPASQLEARSKTAYQTYLTENPPQFDSQFQRENSPNICNNSKEDSSSNPDSGYSSKIYGNRASVQPTSSGGTPSSSFSTDRGLTSNTNSPMSQYSNADYEYLPKRQQQQQQDDEVHSHVNTWYQRKIQETTQKVYDSWRNDRAPAAVAQQQRLPSARYYGNGDYISANQVPTPQRKNQSGFTPSGQPSHLVSTYVVHGSDV